MFAQRKMRRAAISRNAVLLVVSGALLVCGVIVWARSGPEEAQLDNPATVMVAVRCTKCGAEWEMPFPEYDALAKQATSDNASGFTCEKCGAADTAWKQPGLKMNLPPVSPEDVAEAWVNTGTPEEEVTESTDEPAAKPKPAAGLKKED